MQFQEYLDLSKRTLDPSTPLAVEPNYVLGLYGEAGEAVELIKGHFYSGRDLDGQDREKPHLTVRDRIKLELGDVSWYAQAIAHEMGLYILDYSIDSYVSQLGAVKVDLKDSCRGLFRSISGVDREIELFYKNPALGVRPGNVETLVVAVVAYLKHISNLLGFDYGDDVLSANVAKLLKRHPERFSKETSLKREDRT